MFQSLRVRLMTRLRRDRGRPMLLFLSCLLCCPLVCVLMMVANWDGYLGAPIKAPGETYPQFREPTWTQNSGVIVYNSTDKPAAAAEVHLSTDLTEHLHHPIEQPQQEIPEVVLSSYNDLKVVYHAAPAAARDRARQATVTVIISCFLRPASIKQVIQSYLDQSAVIIKVVIYLSGSPVRDEYLKILTPLVKAEPRVEVFDLGSVNLGYFGRLQLGIQTFTDFIVFSDDDIKQGKRVIEALISAFYSDYQGVLGVRGCNFICSAGELQGMPTTVNGPRPLSSSNIRLCSQGPSATHHIPPSGSEVTDPSPTCTDHSQHAQVDTLFSFWLMPSKWVRTLFAEPPPTYRTAEDMFISYIIRKYLGKATYHLRSWHGDFDGDVDSEIGMGNRSWVDTTALSEAQTAIKLPELDQKLAGAIGSNVTSRKYNWERDQVLRLLAEKGNRLARIKWIRRWPLTFSAIVLLGPNDSTPGMEQAIEEVRQDAHVSVFVLCHSEQCDEYRATANTYLTEMLFGNHQRLLESKVYRIRPPTHHTAIFYSRMLLDFATIITTLKIQQISYWEATTYRMELSVLRAATDLHETKLEPIMVDSVLQS